MSHGRINAPVRTPDPAGPSPRAIECRRISVRKARTSRQAWVVDDENRCRGNDGNRVSAKACKNGIISLEIVLDRDEDPPLTR